MTRLARRRFNAALLLGAIAPLDQLLAATWPDRPLRLVVPFAAGGGADIIARAVGTPLGRRLGQPMVVDNRAGGGGTIGADAVAKAPADGYTLLYTTPGPQITNPFLMARLPYDPVNDFTPVGEVGKVPNVLVVNDKLPVRSVDELIRYAKAHPGQLNFGSAGIGSSSHLAGELFKHLAKVDIVHVPYRGTSQAMQDLIGGSLSMAIDSIAVYKNLILAGQVRALGIGTPERAATLPGVPSIAETLPGFDGAPVNYLSVRSGTPVEIVERLGRELAAVLHDPEVVRTLEASGVIPRSSTPREMAAIVQAETAKWKQVIQAAGIKPE